ncbi:MAG: hypothetical protein GY754_40785 [bacterium]|nr:hypothetical protein [bacterium]
MKKLLKFNKIYVIVLLLLFSSCGSGDFLIGKWQLIGRECGECGTCNPIESDTTLTFTNHDEFIIATGEDSVTYKYLGDRYLKICYPGIEEYLFVFEVLDLDRDTMLLRIIKPGKRIIMKDQAIEKYKRI